MAIQVENRIKMNAFIAVNTFDTVYFSLAVSVEQTRDFHHLNYIY